MSHFIRFFFCHHWILQIIYLIIFHTLSHLIYCITSYFVILYLMLHFIFCLLINKQKNIQEVYYKSCSVTMIKQGNARFDQYSPNWQENIQFDSFLFSRRCILGEVKFLRRLVLAWITLYFSVFLVFIKCKISFLLNRCLVC